MKILHVAPINVAGVPYSMMEMQRRFGHETRLVTLHKSDLTFPEDICLHLPLPRSSLARAWRASKKQVSPRSTPRILSPSNTFEALFFKMDDFLRKAKVERAMEEFNLDEYQVVHYDGGLDFFRDARVARRWKEEGKKFVCHYMGSDLRLRGAHPTMDMLSDLNITNESDHLHLHADIHYIHIPFDTSPFFVRTTENKKLRIIHSPTNRSMKGTEIILPVIKQLKKLRDIEFVLAENISHAELLRMKQDCDIAIEQIGNMGGTGYGRNSLENLAMGIPTVTEMTPEYEAWLPEHPFLLANRETLLDRLLEIVDNSKLREQKRNQGRAWVECYHSYHAVHTRLMELYAGHGIA